MKKICIFADFPLSALAGEVSGRGGGQGCTWLPQLAIAWKNETDIEIHWVIFDRTADKPETQKWRNQNFHRIPCPSISASLLMARWPHRLAARKLLLKIKPDLIHCWGTENLNGCALLDFDGPSILSMQGIISTYFKTGDLKGWRWRLFRHWEPISIRKSSVVTCESKWGINQVRSLTPKKTFREIEYGVHPSYYEIMWKPAPDKPRILFVGGLNSLKGVDILLNMLRTHKSREWTMVFIGGGYFADELRSLNDPQIEVMGMLKTTEVQAEMAKAWALVMPSRADTSPNVVKEARVIGLPVIGSPHGGHAAYIQHGEDGFIVDDENPQHWFETIQQMVSSLEDCRNMGQKRHAWFREKFRPEKTANDFLCLYRQLTS